MARIEVGKKSLPLLFYQKVDCFKLKRDSFEYFSCSYISDCHINFANKLEMRRNLSNTIEMHEKKREHQAAQTLLLTEFEDIILLYESFFEANTKKEKIRISCILMPA